MSDWIVLSHHQAAPLLHARRAGDEMVLLSLDLGLTTTEVSLTQQRVVFPTGSWLLWESVEEIAQNESVCYLIEENDAVKIQRFSEALNRFYSLMPTNGAPTLLVSGIPMHRIKGTDPYRDTLTKIRTLAPLSGRVLDTCTGLGYTAIEAAKTTDALITIELDPAVLEIARLNPWSHRLFEDARIQQVIGDSYEEVQEFEENSFSRIIHDPPMFSLAGELYSAETYRHLHRILKPKGRMFHYIGDLSSRSGRNVTRGAVRRLQDVGFSRVVRRPEAFGLVVYK